MQLVMRPSARHASSRMRICPSRAGNMFATASGVGRRSCALRCGVHLHRLGEARSSTSRERSGAPNGKSILPGSRAGDLRQRIDQQFAAPRSPRARIRQTVGIAPGPAPCRASVRHALICWSSIPIASAQGGHSGLDWYRDSAPVRTCFRGLSCVISFCSRRANT